jgi:coenzyme Q-binding protein COQ10
MPKASVKRLIKCNKNQLIDLVLDIEKYPTFVPYCIDAKIYEKNDTSDFINIIADLTIGKGLFKDTYRSDVKFNKKHNTIYVTNIDGPLKHLDNKWFFEDHKEGTEIFFDVDFEIKNKFLNIMMTTSFKYGLDKIVDAFQKRANQLFKSQYSL